MKSNSGFTLLELLCGLFICSLILVFLVPNLILEFQKLKETEQNLTAKEIIYEEIVLHDSTDFTVKRDGYIIELRDKKVSATNLATGVKVIYE